MRRMEERYKRYVEKARTVIKTLDPKQKSSAPPAEVQVLKNQLTEKDRKIQHLEVRHTQRQTAVYVVVVMISRSSLSGGEAHHLSLVQHGEETTGTAGNPSFRTVSKLKEYYHSFLK
uniref:Hook C-terminal domain-containing protein n=1 Tax=Cyprinus carpio TaxID=7962 RepID=A0A8C1U339_CYPCA